MLSEHEDSDFSEEFEDDGDDYDTVSIASDAGVQFYKRRAEQLEGDLEERDNEIDRLKAENERLQYSDGSLNASKAERCERKSKDHLRTARNEYAKVVQERKEMETCVAKMFDVCKHMQQCSAEDSVALRNIRSALVSVPNMGPVVEVLRNTDKRMSLSDRVRNMNGRLGDALKKLSKLLHTANSQAERNLHKAERRINGAQQVKRKRKTPKRKSNQVKIVSGETIYLYKSDLPFDMSIYLGGVHKAMVAQANANGKVRIGDGVDNQWLNRAMTQPNPDHPFGLEFRVAKHVLYNEKYCLDASSPFYGAHENPTHSLTMLYPSYGRMCKHGYWAGIHACIAYMKEHLNLDSPLVQSISPHQVFFGTRNDFPLSCNLCAPCLPNGYTESCT